MESNRVAFFRELGLWSDDPAGGIGIILAAISCNYRIPVTYPDTVHVGTSVKKVGSRSIGMRQVVFSEKAQAIVADSESTVVVYDYQLAQSCAIPEGLREALSGHKAGS
jgi:acyl-CoA thioester hydrolase